MPTSSPSHLLPPFVEELLEPACSVAMRAGQRILKIFDQGFEVNHKSDRSPVTTADMAAHTLIVNSLEGLTPELPVLSEESGHIPFAIRQDWTTYWLVDPLDGTRQFVARNEGFCVNIALIHRHEPVLGVIFAPKLDRGCYACRGAGAYQFRPGSLPEPVRTRKRQGEGMIIAGSASSHTNPAMLSLLDRIGPHTLIRQGSAVKFCMVASGSADLYPRLGPTSEWDTAAGQCIVEEAGGMVLDTNLEPLTYNRKASLVNPPFLAVGDQAYEWSEVL